MVDQFRRIHLLQYALIEHRDPVGHRKGFLVITGEIGSGKTTMLNCLSMFIKPELKVVSVEDTAELNLPHENWVPGLTREGFGGKSASRQAVEAARLAQDVALGLQREG